jgi:ketosteroid isomerase-like protein
MDDQTQATTGLLAERNAAARHRKVVETYFGALERGDIDVLRSVYHEDVVRWSPRPGGPGRDGKVPLRGRENLLAEVERMVAEDDLVAVQYVMRATTKRGEPYENYYHFLLRFEDDQIIEKWEYIDTLYAQQMFRPVAPGPGEPG